MLVSDISLLCFRMPLKRRNLKILHLTAVNPYVEGICENVGKNTQMFLIFLFNDTLSAMLVIIFCLVIFLSFFTLSE